MAASSADDIHTQLAGLLGKRATDIVNIRMTQEDPPGISVIDVVQVITGMTKNNAGNYFERMKTTHLEVPTNCRNYRFPGRGQRATPVMADTRSIVELILALPGRHAARVRRQAAALLVRYLGGDLSLVDEVCALRGFQEQVAVDAPEDPRRLFGEAVEASSSSTSTQLANLFAAMNQRLTNQERTLSAQGQMLARIHESLEHDRQRVNLNVRAPKRAVPHQPHITRDLAGVGRPFPVARFLDAKEREDPSWKSARRSFAPTFSMQVQVLKKKKLREEGKAAVYIEQNHRPQLLYTEEDRPLMQEAWDLTAAHREDLTGRQVNPQDAPALLDQPERPSVMDLLQRNRE